ncbi:NAD(P)/FAD-dependent oxidoreductase [Hymenobacter jejuensis]|uniref:NAD(P)/FAD-dependent oxidoreductase n=1 Tax=Hymenobacter jejuensis TaxID=2502781 RepID=UPI0013FD0467|nr:geranylgeranyl reductase family protein [Hymenobacter jejuensis]
MNQHYDVVIIGAGPAGTACALALQGSGLRVALVDRKQFPRDKICGDAIPSPALKAIRQLSQAWYDELFELTTKAETRNSRLVAPNGTEIVVQWKARTFNSPRLHFDQHLLSMVKRHTKTEVLENFGVKRLEISAQQATVFPSAQAAPLTAALVIGCDGANSVVARQLTNRTLDRTRQCAAVRAYFTGLSESDEQTSEFFFLDEYRSGYFWIFPVGQGVFNVGFGMLSAQIAARKLDLKQVLRHLTQTHPRLATRFAQAKQLSDIQGFGLPLGGVQRPISGARFLLAGDAAALIDPLQGHGIDKAVQSGILAAQQAVRCFQTHDFSAAQLFEYDRQVQTHIGKKLARSYHLMHFLSAKAWLVNGAFRFGRHPLIKNLLLKAVG